MLWKFAFRLRRKSLLAANAIYVTMATSTVFVFTPMVLKQLAVNLFVKSILMPLSVNCILMLHLDQLFQDLL